MDKKVSSIKFLGENFPNLLKEIPNPPKEIFVSGNLPSDKNMKIAIVGTRKATQIGKSIARQIASELSRLNIAIISGLAMGIDSAAHQGVIDSKGKTVAVLANGLDKIYPAQNENLAKEILKLGGALISEYPARTPSLPYRFLERNRIISGLSIATIVIEAPDRSGSLATARYALEQGREVLVIPGPANHPNYAGSHKLIRDGARLITSTQDILEDLNIEITDCKLSVSDKIMEMLNDEEKEILETLKNSAQPLGVDKICELTKLSSQTVNSAMASFIINGIIKETETGYSL